MSPSCDIFVILLVFRTHHNFWGASLSTLDTHQIHKCKCPYVKPWVYKCKHLLTWYMSDCLSSFETAMCWFFHSGLRNSEGNILKYHSLFDSINCSWIECMWKTWKLMPTLHKESSQCSTQIK